MSARVGDVRSAGELLRREDGGFGDLKVPCRKCGRETTLVGWLVKGLMAMNAKARKNGSPEIKNNQIALCIEADMGKQPKDWGKRPPYSCYFVERTAAQPRPRSDGVPTKRKRRGVEEV